MHLASRCIKYSTLMALASFLGCRALVEKKEPGRHCLCLFSSSRISGNFHEICSVTLTSARRAEFMPASNDLLHSTAYCDHTIIPVVILNAWHSVSGKCFVELF